MAVWLRVAQLAHARQLRLKNARKNLLNFGPHNAAGHPRVERSGIVPAWLCHSYREMTRSKKQ